jgi:hypothetical protein
MEGKERLRVSVKGVESFQVNIPTAEVQSKLLFKYSEFMVEDGDVRTPEYWRAVSTRCNPRI